MSKLECLPSLHIMSCILSDTGTVLRNRSLLVLFPYCLRMGLSQVRAKIFTFALPITIKQRRVTVELIAAVYLESLPLRHLEKKNRVTDGGMFVQQDIIVRA